MALFRVKTSKKIETSVRLEESTAQMLDRYAHYHKAEADDVVNESLEYIFKRDKEFQKELASNPTQEVTATLRVRRPSGPTKSAKSRDAGTELSPAATKAATT